MKVLDLFCGAGGIIRGFLKAGFEVEGVDNSEVVEATFEENNHAAFTPANLVREITTPVTSPEDIYTPDEKGTWRIEADLGNGQVISETLDVSFFVLPESPIGAVAMMLASVGALGGFLYFRSRKPMTGN